MTEGISILLPKIVIRLFFSNNFLDCVQRSASSIQALACLYHRIQFGGVLFYEFLRGIGLSPAKSKTLVSVNVPDIYFADFLRGLFDGDGSSSSFYDCVYKNSFRFSISFASASPAFINWLRARITLLVGIRGHITTSGNRALMLRFGKRASVVLSSFMYYSQDLPCLQRKYLKICKSLNIIESCRGGEIGKHAAFRAQFSQGIGSSNLPRGTKVQ